MAAADGRIRSAFQNDEDGAAPALDAPQRDAILGERWQRRSDFAFRERIEDHVDEPQRFYRFVETHCDPGGDVTTRVRRAPNCQRVIGWHGKIAAEVVRNAACARGESRQAELESKLSAHLPARA